MANIIIVDDEYFVRMGIKAIVNRKEKEHSVIGEAENGKSAVQMILERKPDMVFLDITMPGMDGIQVLETIRQQGYQGYVAMLTCHGDFTFAQKALRLGADDYVLKNELVGDDMLDYLDKAALKISASRENPSGQGAGAGDKGDEQHFYKENFLKNILQIGGISREEFVRGCARYHVKVHADGIYVITIHMNHWQQIVNRYKDSDLQVFFSAVDNMMAEIFKSQEEWEGFYTDPYRYHILITCSGEKSVLSAEQNIRNIVDHISYHFERILDIDVTISVYQNTYQINELYKAYEQAKLLLEQRFFYPERRIFWNGILHSCKTADLDDLDSLLEQGEEEGSSIVELLEQYLEKNKNMQIDREIFLKSAEQAVKKLERKYGICMEHDISSTENVREMLEVIYCFEEKVKKEKEDSSYSFLVKQAVQIIKKNFTKKITLEEVAEQLGISAGYFSRIFSSETQETFSNYVIRRRIEYAQELIMTTNYKFYEIAEMCGFSSPVHFNNTFKKLCGVTPNQYRKKN